MYIRYNFAAKYKEIYDNSKVSYCQYDFFEKYYTDAKKTELASKDLNKLFIPESVSSNELAKKYGGSSGPCPPFVFNS